MYQPMRQKVEMVQKRHRLKQSLQLEEIDGKYYLRTNLFDAMPEIETSMIATETLGEAFEPEQKFENPDGSPILFDRDYLDDKRKINPMPGPFEKEEVLERAIWE